jgi:hypothetical protein
MRKFKAANVMSKPVQCLLRVDRVGRVLQVRAQCAGVSVEPPPRAQVLRETKHNGFPIVDSERVCCALCA